MQVNFSRLTASLGYSLHSCTKTLRNLKRYESWNGKIALIGGAITGDDEKIKYLVLISEGNFHFFEEEARFKKVPIKEENLDTAPNNVTSYLSLPDPINIYKQKFQSLFNQENCNLLSRDDSLDSIRAKIRLICATLYIIYGIRDGESMLRLKTSLLLKDNARILLG